MYATSVNSFEQWRTAARKYLSADIPPSNIQWSCDQQAGLFADQQLAKSVDMLNISITVPREFMSRIRQASCFIGQIKPEAKWSLFYSLLWRIKKVDRNTLLVKSDSQVQQLERMTKSVSRDMHKMKAFVRFKNQTSIFAEAVLEEENTNDHYTAWFEPDHAIIKAIAPFFVKRFTSMNWSILTPHGCAHWNQKQLIHSPGINRPDINEDEFDDFWRAYYRSIFNPARLKEKAMRSEMPKKYWKYLPESICIKDLTSSSAARVEAMTSSESTDSERIRQRSKRVTEIQNQLRKENRS